ncbi:MAG: hypothetical protein KA236_13705 [Verrucomicrobia bacterium]|jgi:anti-sigma factor RsiW|nr:hypothetical protein [Verrucomicrobiota bacterium]
MNKARYEQLREAAWRRPLTTAEQAELADWLATQPEARADWETEIALTTALTRLPDTPVPSNFTARVLQAIEREAAVRETPARSAWGSVWRRWLPRVALGVSAVVVLIGVAHVHHAAQRTQLARSVVAAARVAPTLSPEALADYEFIRRLSPAPGADTELLMLLQ